MKMLKFFIKVKGHNSVTTCLRNLKFNWASDLHTYNIYVKFHENSLTSFPVKARTNKMLKFFKVKGHNSVMTYLKNLKFDWASDLHAYNVYVKFH